MGFLRDIENMPNLYDYSLEFFKRYYRPEYTTSIVAGDVKHEACAGDGQEVLGRVEARQLRARDSSRARADQRDDPTSIGLPRRCLGRGRLRGRRISDEQKDMAAMDLIGSLGFSSNSELYQRLVIKEQKVDALFFVVRGPARPVPADGSGERKDPKDVDYVKGEIIKTFDSFKTIKVPKEKLEAVKSNLKYSFALEPEQLRGHRVKHSPLTSRLRRTPETLNKSIDVYASITPEDIQAMAKKYFVDTAADDGDACRTRRSRRHANQWIVLVSYGPCNSGPWACVREAGKGKAKVAPVLCPTPRPWSASGCYSTRARPRTRRAKRAWPP